MIKQAIRELAFTLTGVCILLIAILVIAYLTLGFVPAALIALMGLLTFASSAVMCWLMVKPYGESS